MDNETTNQDFDQLVTTRELADRLGVHKRTIQRWVLNGIIPEPMRFSTRSVRHNYEQALKSLKERSITFGKCG